VGPPSNASPAIAANGNDGINIKSQKLSNFLTNGGGAPTGASSDSYIGYFAFAVRFRSFVRLCFASCFTNSSFDALNSIRAALSMRSASVSPGTDAAGSGFMLPPFYAAFAWRYDRFSGVTRFDSSDALIGCFWFAFVWAPGCFRFSSGVGSEALMSDRSLSLFDSLSETLGQLVRANHADF
jgi:hypothetical protein